jgi:transaldolase
LPARAAVFWEKIDIGGFPKTSLILGNALLMEGMSMPETGYFLEVNQKTPTRFWINNPTVREAEYAMAAGAAGCTTNPSYTAKMLVNPDAAGQVKRLLRRELSPARSDTEVAGAVQRVLVKELSDLFMPLYESSGGKEGFVTIQSDPLEEGDPDFIIREGRAARRIAANIMIKIPVTGAGIDAVKTLVKENCPVMATEVMTVSQAIRICEAYREASEESGCRPVFYVTHITGILDDYFQGLVRQRNLKIAPEILSRAGISLAKRQYALLAERNCPGRMIGGGARKLADFTELVGGDLTITINWKGTADELIRIHPPVVSRIGEQAGPETIELLRRELPGYAEAWDEDGLKPEEFFEYGGVELFRNSFIKSWRELLAAVREERQAASQRGNT